MAGVGEAGLLVSLIPLLISTAEHYEDVLRPFRRWRNVLAEVERFQHSATVQKAIYETECHLLLWTITSRERATAILGNRVDIVQQTQWINTELEHRFSRSAGAYLAVVEQIRKILDEIESEGRDLDRMFDSHKSKKV